jgi:hypothetical protein
MIIIQKVSRQINVKSVIKFRSVAQKQSRVAVSAQKIARKTSVKKTRKTSIERKKAFKKYKIKRKNEKTNSDDESTRQDFNVDHIINKKKTIKALREIRRMQRSTNLIISRLFFDRIARNILYDIDATFRIKKSAMNALQKAFEAMLTTKLKSKIS